MKKRLISMLFVLLLAVALIPAAFADVTTNLGSFSAGSELSQPIFVSEGDFSYDALQLPAGCDLQLVGDRVCLVGTPTAAGSFCFNIAASDIYTCYVDIMPDTPNCYVSGGGSCGVNDNMVITVSASVRDGGVLSYQWYSNSVASVVGGTPIPGATTPAFTASTSVPGTSYYYCNVTNNNCGITMNAYSDAVTVIVENYEPDVSSIGLFQKPDKTEYKIGETVDTMGMKLEVRYSDGTTKIIDSDYSVSPSRIDADTRYLTVRYKDVEVTVPVNVAKKLNAAVYKLPTKNEYIVGELLDTEGLILKLSTEGSANPPEFISSGFTCEPRILNTVGTQKITVKYKDTTSEFSVKVVEKGEDTLNVVTLPLKTEYNVGDRLELTGLVLELKSGTKTTPITSGYSCTVQELETPGKQTITVKYQNLSCTFEINVSGEASEATPAPGATPPRGSTIEVDTHHTLMVIIIILAVLALITLIIYIVVLRAKKQDISPIERFIDPTPNKPKQDDDDLYNITFDDMLDDDEDEDKTK